QPPVLLIPHLPRRAHRHQDAVADRAEGVRGNVMATAAARRTPAPKHGVEAIRPSVQITFPTNALTLAGFRQWLVSDACPEKGVFGFLDTEIYIDMSPERLGSHNAVKTELTRALATLVAADDLGQYFT